MSQILCPCTSGLNYTDCCKIYHQNETVPSTAEALMRSRYSAYALHLIAYLIDTTHPSTRHLHQKGAIRDWATNNIWLKLEICSANGCTVEFKAYYENNKQLHIHHERSTFSCEEERWYYVSGEYFN
ncbi:YchJ family protein [Pedobacter polaris]|uniref:YchJ family protein n=1 Tax=Pedobacter polaris TaxID=2571273 RepID=A0A4U1CTJ6_9SPHI|nr:YchJ family protein [Pedobacter polaris]TKC10405.1 YchJ family protein [Pedobacter polaris]